MSWIIYNGVSFNADELKKLKKTEFVKHEAHHGFSAEDMNAVWVAIRGTETPAAVEDSGDGA